MTLWVVGGEQHKAFREQPEWTMFRRALVVRVENGELERVLEYCSPPEHCPDESPSHVFKAATVCGSKAYLCTQTEILICDFPTFRIHKVVSLPCFNDLHHATVAPDGTLYAAVTGLDAVAQLTPDGELMRLVSVAGGSPWDRFDPSVDYRKVPTTKPHRAHPNYVFFLDGRPWVTLFEQRDAAPLDGDGEPFRIADHGVHDGHVRGGEVWFTSVAGQVIRVDVASRRRVVVDLNSLNAEPGRVLGWCRSLLPGGDGVWVGFSRIRFTRFRENLSWMRHGFRGGEAERSFPTRIVRYQLAGPHLEEEIDLEPAGMNAIFSIHADVD